MMAKNNITMSLYYIGPSTALIQMSHQSGYGRLAVVYPDLRIAGGLSTTISVQYDDGPDFWFLSWSQRSVEDYVPQGATDGSLLAPQENFDIGGEFGDGSFSLTLEQTSSGSSIIFTRGSQHTQGTLRLGPPQPVPTPLKRKSVASLSANEQSRYVTAVKAMKDRPSQFAPPTNSRYDDYVYIHMQVMFGFGLTLIDPNQSVTNSNWLMGAPLPSSAHQCPAFLPWHREFLHQFELDLHRLSPLTYDDGSPMGIPYWDWVTNSAKNGIPWLQNFMGGNGDNEYVVNGKNVHVVSGPVTAGPFARGTWPITLSQDRLPYLVRQFGVAPGAPSLPSAQEVTDTLAETAYDQDPWNERVQSPTFRNHLEGFYPFGNVGMHNLVHSWVGGNAGTMLYSTSPNDPVFFLHHSNIDRLWAVWQRRNTNYRLSTPLTPFYAPPNPIPGRQGQGLNEAMLFYSSKLSSKPPWPEPAKTPAQVLDHHALNYYYDDEVS